MRQKKKPIRHFKRKLHMGNGDISNSDVWSWRLKQITDHNGVQTFKGLQIRDPQGKDHLAEKKLFIRPIEYDYENFMCDGPGVCEYCDAPLNEGGYRPSTIKRYIQTVLINDQPWELFPNDHS